MDSKNILNQRKKVNPITEIGDTSSIKIINTDKFIDLRVNKHWALTQGAYNLSKSILLAVSPLFLNKDKQVANNITNTTGFKDIAIFIENKPHYTGGRYSIYHQAIILSHFCKVTVYMNEIPPFVRDFKDYKTENFSLSIDKNFGLNAEINEHDLVIGTPLSAGEFAIEYAKKFNIKSYLILFESPNWISSMRDGIDANAHFWDGYKKALKECDIIIVPSFESRKWAIEWLGQDNIEVVYPCMNEFVARKVRESDEDIYVDSSKKHILFNARMTSFKNPLSIIKKFPNREKYVFHFIGKIWEDGKNQIEKLSEQGWELINHGRISDKEKFLIIKNMDIIIFPTNFEGFGMPPMEALYFNKPVITYDLPVLKEIYGEVDGVYFSPKGDERAFVNKVINTLKHYESFKADITVPDFHHPRKCASKLLDILGIPKISTGTIVYNGEDYLEYSLNSIKNMVWEMIVIDGKVAGYDKLKRVTSTDGTKNIIAKLEFNDPLGKIKYFQIDKLAQDKIELQNEIVKRITGQYYVKLDHDEIWKPQTLKKAIDILEEKPTVQLIKMSFLHFWLSFKRIALDNNGKWSTKHARVWRWRKDFKHTTSFNYFTDKEGVKVSAPFYQEETLIGHHIFHFGWVRKYELLMNKLDFYKNRGIESYSKDTITDWKDNNSPTMPTQNEKSWAEDFMGSLPIVLNNHPYISINDVRELDKKIVTTDNAKSMIKRR